MLSGAMREEEKLAYETLLHRWFEEVWNQGRENTIDELSVRSGERACRLRD